MKQQQQTKELSGVEVGLTEDQAVRMAHSRWWVGMDPRDVAMFQLHEPRLCMNLSDFHHAAERALGRPVYIHELGLNRGELIRELIGERPAPTLSEIVRLIPASKRVVAWPDGKIDEPPQ
jgi:hypothetical protein